MEIWRGVKLTPQKKLPSKSPALFGLSDQDLVASALKVNHQRFQHPTIRCRNYSKYNLESLKFDLKNFDMPHLYKIDNFNLAWEFLQNVLIYLFNKLAPVISKRVKDTLCPLLTVSIKNQINRRDQPLRKFWKSKNEIDWKNYKNLRNKCTSLIRKPENKIMKLC